MVARYRSALKMILKDRWGAGAYIDDVLKTTRKKKWSELTDKEQGAYEALESLYSANDDLRMYERQLFYALQDDELFKAFKAGKLNNAFAGKILDKKINTMFDDYIKRIENMIKANEKNKGSYHRVGPTGGYRSSDPYTADDIYALYQEMQEKALLELMQYRKSLNQLVYPHGGSIDDAGRLDVIAEALEVFEHSDALQIGKGTWQERQTAATRFDPILINLRKLKTHVDDLPEEQLDWAGTAGTADDLDFWDGEDATSFADAYKNDWGLNRDRIYASVDNVAPEGRYVPIKPANFDFILEGDVWPLPPKTGKTPKEAPKFEAIDPEMNKLAASRKASDRIWLEERKTDLEGRIATAESYIRNPDEPQLNRQGQRMLEEAQEALDEVLTELERLKMNGTTKKQGGGFIDSPLYLRDY